MLLSWFKIDANLSFLTHIADYCLPNTPYAFFLVEHALCLRAAKKKLQGSHRGAYIEDRAVLTHTHTNPSDYHVKPREWAPEFSFCPKRNRDKPQENMFRDEKKTKMDPSEAIEELVEERVSPKRKKDQLPRGSVPPEKKPKMDQPEAIRQSRQADQENTDHLEMRAHAVKEFVEEPNPEDEECTRISTAGEWATRKDWKLMRLALNIGFNVYDFDESGNVVFKFSDPQDETKEKLTMVNVMHDGVHYDVLIIGLLSADKLQGYV
jgi:hypothetical protein